MDVGSLSRVKSILEEYGTISGLECNVETTILMSVGTDIPMNQKLPYLVFDIQDEITLLGLIKQKDSGLWEKNFEKLAMP
jgi:hypothetical protein